MLLARTTASIGGEAAALNAPTTTTVRSICGEGGDEVGEEEGSSGVRNITLTHVNVEVRRRQADNTLVLDGQPMGDGAASSTIPQPAALTAVDAAVEPMNGR